MEHDTARAAHLDSIAAQLRDIGDSLAQLGPLTDPSALRDDVRAAYREFADRLAAWREHVDAAPVTELSVAQAFDGSATTALSTAVRSASITVADPIEGQR